MARMSNKMRFLALIRSLPVISIIHRTSGNRWVLSPLVYTIEYPYLALMLISGTCVLITAYRKRSSSKQAA